VLRPLIVRACLAVLPLIGGACSKTPPNVLVVVIDTLRVDRVTAKAGDAAVMPFLHGLAERGAFFSNAHAQSSWTNPSVATIFTSRYQSQHRITAFNSTLAEEELTLAEVLREHGYATGGFIANVLLRAKLGFGQGFDRYETYARQDRGGNDDPAFAKPRAERINRESLAWLDERRRTEPHRPVFLYLHFMEPHNPYDPPDPYLERVLRGRPRPDVADVNRRMAVSTVATFDEQQVQAMRDCYDAEAASVDAALRDLFEQLRSRGFLDDCIVVITADHGEEMHEHGLMGHDQTLYEEVLRVPLIVLAPGTHDGTTVSGIVSLVAVAPTVLDLAGIAVPTAFEGRSLRAQMPGRQSWWPFRAAGSTSGPEPPGGGIGIAYSELIKDPGATHLRPHERAVVTESAKLISNVDGTSEFYDLRTDPAEAHPDEVGPEARAALSQLLVDFTARTGGAPPSSSRVILDDQTRERMRALGYQE